HVAGSARFNAATNAIEARLDASGLDWARLPHLPAAARRVGGMLSGSLLLAGQIGAPSGQASLALAGPTLDGTPLPPLTFTARADGRTMTVSGAAEREFLHGTGTFETGWPPHATVDVAALPLAGLARAFPSAKDSQATVEATGTVDVDVPLREPAR